MVLYLNLRMDLSFHGKKQFKSLIHACRYMKQNLRLRFFRNPVGCKKYKVSAKGALSHCLQCCTGCNIQNYLLRMAKWLASATTDNTNPWSFLGQCMNAMNHSMNDMNRCIMDINLFIINMTVCMNVMTLFVWYGSLYKWLWLFFVMTWLSVCWYGCVN